MDPLLPSNIDTATYQPEPEPEMEQQPSDNIVTRDCRSAWRDVGVGILTVLTIRSIATAGVPFVERAIGTIEPNRAGRYSIPLTVVTTTTAVMTCTSTIADTIHRVGLDGFVARALGIGAGVIAVDVSAPLVAHAIGNIGGKWLVDGVRRAVDGAASVAFIAGAAVALGALTYPLWEPAVRPWSVTVFGVKVKEGTK